MASAYFRLQLLPYLLVPRLVIPRAVLLLASTTKLLLPRATLGPSVLRERPVGAGVKRVSGLKACTLASNPQLDKVTRDEKAVGKRLTGAAARTAEAALKAGPSLMACPRMATSGLQDGCALAADSPIALHGAATGPRRHMSNPIAVVLNSTKACENPQEPVYLWLGWLGTPTAGSPLGQGTTPVAQVGNALASILVRHPDARIINVASARTGLGVHRAWQVFTGDPGRGPVVWASPPWTQSS